MTMLTASEAAQALGLSKRHLYALAAKGLLPCYRFGAAYFIDGKSAHGWPDVLFLPAVWQIFSHTLQSILRRSAAR